MTPPEERAKQLECEHPGHAIVMHCYGPTYYQCRLCSVVVAERDVAIAVRGSSEFGERAISRRSVEMVHDAEDLRAATSSFLLEKYGYSPEKGNTPPGLAAIRWEFQKSWPGLWGRIARHEESYDG